MKTMPAISDTGHFILISREILLDWRSFILHVISVLALTLTFQSVLISEQPNPVSDAEHFFFVLCSCWCCMNILCRLTWTWTGTQTGTQTQNWTCAGDTDIDIDMNTRHEVWKCLDQDTFSKIHMRFYATDSELNSIPYIMSQWAPFRTLSVVPHQAESDIVHIRMSALLHCSLVQSNMHRWTSLTRNLTS
jgi:hypothetical protein